MADWADYGLDDEGLYVCTVCGRFVPCRQHPLADVRRATAADHEAQRETRKPAKAPRGDEQAVARTDEPSAASDPQNGAESPIVLPVRTRHPEAYVLVDLRGEVWMWRVGRWWGADRPTIVRAADVVSGALGGRCTCESCWPSLTADLDVDSWYRQHRGGGEG